MSWVIYAVFCRIYVPPLRCCVGVVDFDPTQILSPVSKRTHLNCLSVMKCIDVGKAHILLFIAAPRSNSRVNKYDDIALADMSMSAIA